MNTPADFIETSCALLDAVRAEAPLVHCMTNAVVTGYTANCLIALGGAPAMIHDADEAAQFAGIAKALLVNVGTLTRDQADAMCAAIASARAAGTPWVLDPVAVGFLSLRTALCAELKTQSPAIIRGNASEIIALAGYSATSRGVDSTVDDTAAAVDAAQKLADETGAAVLVTGKIDRIVSPHNACVVAVSGGNALMTRVTGVGCAQGALAGAFLAVAASPQAAAVGVSVVMKVAGEIAADSATQHVATRPGSYQIALLDALDAITPDDIRRRGNIAV